MTKKFVIVSLLNTVFLHGISDSPLSSCRPLAWKAETLAIAIHYFLWIDTRLAFGIAYGFGLHFDFDIILLSM